MTDSYWWLGVIFPIFLCLWYTLLLGGLAYLYWFAAGIPDPRDIFPRLFSDLGAILMFPFGWLYLCLSAWTD